MNYILEIKFTNGTEYDTDSLPLMKILEAVAEKMGWAVVNATEIEEIHIVPEV